MTSGHYFILTIMVHPTFWKKTNTEEKWNLFIVYHRLGTALLVKRESYQQGNGVTVSVFIVV